ncbi:hypothetical protein PTKIN_Ptkin15bG0150300 [Pterospermum kingtungense]
MKVIEKAWEEVKGQSEHLNLWQKLRRVKRAIKEWYSTEGLLDPFQIAKLEEEIHVLEPSSRVDNSWTGIREEIISKKVVLWSILRKEECSW